MKVLITGALGNVGKGMTARLRAAGQVLVLHDLEKLPDAERFVDFPSSKGTLRSALASSER